METPPDDGTPLADKSREPTMPPYTTYRREALSRISGNWMLRRPLSMLVLFVPQAILLWLSGYPRELFAVFMVLQVLHLGGLFAWRRAAQKGGDPVRLSYLSQLHVMAMQCVLIALTGGLRSPILCGLAVSTTGTLVAHGRSRESRVLLVLAALSLAALAMLPPWLTGPTLQGPYFGAMVTLSMGFSLTLLGTIVLGVVDAYQTAGASLERAREASLREAQSRVRVLESVGAKLAHELKNPLAAVKALAQLASSSRNPERTSERLTVALGEIERMEAILRDYLSFARPLETLRTEPVALDALAREVVELLDERALLAGVSLRCDALTVSIDADGRRLKSALVDLLSNALEATSAGGEVVLTVRPDAEQGAVLAVRDTGSGMSAAELQRVGTPFFTTREGGTGLGVVLARAAARQHGGSLEFASERGKGTTATLRLPCAPPAEPR